MGHDPGVAAGAAVLEAAAIAAGRDGRRAVTRAAGFDWSGGTWRLTPSCRRSGGPASDSRSMARRPATASTAGANRHGRLSVGRRGSGSGGGRPRGRVDRAADLRRRQALERPGGMSGRRISSARPGGIVAPSSADGAPRFGRRALLVTAGDDEPGVRLERGDGRLDRRRRPAADWSIRSRESRHEAARPRDASPGGSPTRSATSGQRSTSISASKTSAAGRCDPDWTSWRIAIRRALAVRRPEAVRRAAAEPLRWRAVLEDQVPTTRLCSARVQPLGHRLERPIAELDRQPRVRLEVACPGRLRVRGGDEDRAVGILDEADVDGARRAGPARPTVVSRATTPRRASAESSGCVSGSADDGGRRRRVAPARNTQVANSADDDAGRRAIGCRRRVRIGRRRREVGDAACEGVGHRDDRVRR